MNELFLGVDGGQTGTTAMIGDQEGRILGIGRGGPCSYVGAAEGRTLFIAAMKECLAGACRGAGLTGDTPSFRAAVLGFSGGPPDREPVIREVLRADRLAVTSDVEIALTGAFAGEPGIITIAGTGSAAFGKNAAGRTARAGGWGPMFGDEGAAFDLTRQALRAALRYEEGWGPPTVLHARLLEATGAGHVHDLVRMLYTAAFPTSRIASYARLVDEAAREGDRVALGILERAAAYLAGLAKVVRRRLFAPSEGARVAHIGGTFRIPALLARFRALLEAGQRCTVTAPVYGPAAGALLAAYRLAGLQPVLTGLPESEK